MLLTKIIDYRSESALFGGPNDRASGRDDGERYGEPLDEVCLFFALGLAGANVDDVVLRQVVDGRVEDVGVADVDGVDSTLAAFFADDGDATEVGVGGEVAGLGYGLEESDAVAGAGVSAVGVGGAEDAVAEVAEFNRYDGFLDVSAFDDAAADFVGRLWDGEAGDVDLAQDGEVDVAFGVDAVVLVVRYLGGSGGLAAGRDAIRAGRDVEGDCELGVLAADDDGEAVVALDAGLESLSNGVSLVVGHVGDVEVIFLRFASAGAQEEHAGSYDYYGFFKIHSAIQIVGCKIGRKVSNFRWFMNKKRLIFL